METTTAAHANNLFPTAISSAPDLSDEQASTRAAAAAGFPTAPVLKPGALAAEIAAIATEAAPATGTKAERAMAYLRTCPNETAKRADLAAAIGVEPSDIVAYLKPALTNGRIARDGNLFSIGVEPEPHESKRAAPAPKKTVNDRSQPAPKAVAQVSAAKPNLLPIATMSVSDFSVAVWPDGAMQVHTGGATLELSALQMGALKMFLELVDSSGPTNS
ncbi:hypothetical protein [Caballeronia sordidicola]|uniref:Uncharacterized protein n=1 Tax=Caballeronia sordidicola TaxID=196367 RepID=A0A242N710_CABSO|nr:hypothetical protein [Caballeronia sordidicola]OTP79447.1 hypothetical protein PAMC26577_00870 [Caballeronia sordidicola]